MPGEHGGGAAIWAPGLGQLAQLLLGRLVRKAKQPSDLDQHGKVAGGEDIAAALGKEEVDFRRPAADALDLGEERNRFLIVFGPVLEVKLARDDEFGEASDLT